MSGSVNDDDQRIDNVQVMVATSGAQLLPTNAVKTLCTELLPEAFLVTPNIPEANLMLEESGHSPIPIRDLKDLKKLASAVLSLGPRYVLLKGGHIPLDSGYGVAESRADRKIVVNLLLGSDLDEIIEAPYQDSDNTHGTGCSLACKSPCFRRELSSSRLADRQQLPLLVIWPIVVPFHKLSVQLVGTSALASEQIPIWDRVQVL